MLVHPDIDPVAFSIGPLAVRWYGLMYLAGFAGAWWLGARRIARGAAPLSRMQFDLLMLAGMLGVIFGGRLGYVLLYNPRYFAEHPAEMLATWQGGMSFHGGLLGVMLAAALVAWRQRTDYLRLTDFVAPLVPPGIAAELYGRVTDLPCGMAFRALGAGAAPSFADLPALRSFPLSRRVHPRARCPSRPSRLGAHHGPMADAAHDPRGHCAVLVERPPMNPA